MKHISELKNTLATVNEQYRKVHDAQAQADQRSKAIREQAGTYRT
jgi:hypothetical protein